MNEENCCVHFVYRIISSAQNQTAKKSDKNCRRDYRVEKVFFNFFYKVLVFRTKLYEQNVSEIKFHMYYQSIRSLGRLLNKFALQLNIPP